MNFDSDYAPRLAHRANGFRTIMGLLRQRREAHGPLVIVETGCLRSLNWEGDGCSSILFHDFVTRTQSRLFCLDIEPKHCAFAQQHCPEATVICGDSVRSLYCLRQKVKQIDFLYLDSFDVDWNNPHPSALHHLKELCAAAPLLHPGSLVFIDDNATQSGKPLYVKNFMESIGAEKVFEEYQVGFVMP